MKVDDISKIKSFSRSVRFTKKDRGLPIYRGWELCATPRRHDPLRCPLVLLEGYRDRAAWIAKYMRARRTPWITSVRCALGKSGPEQRRPVSSWCSGTRRPWRLSQCTLARNCCAMPMAHSNEVNLALRTRMGRSWPLRKKNLLKLFKGLDVCRLCVHVLLDDRSVFHTMGREYRLTTGGTYPKNVSLQSSPPDEREREIWHWVIHPRDPIQSCKEEQLLARHLYITI